MPMPVDTHSCLVRNSLDSPPPVVEPMSIALLRKRLT
jgi:hypothetical protein